MRPRLPLLASTKRITHSTALFVAASCMASPAFAEHNAATTRWTLSNLFSHSSLSGQRDDWNTNELELLYRANSDLILGGRVDVRNREQGTDTLYTALFSYQATPSLEWHGSLRLAPSADFSPLQTYVAGVQWRNSSKTALLFDVERLNFPEGSINQYKPGLTYWFTDKTYLTGRYTYGRAFNEESYDAGSLRLTIGLPGDRKLVLGVAHGADPEKDPAVPGVILTTANTYSAYFHLPLSPGLELVLGAEHEDRRDIYRRNAVTLGFVWRY